MTSTNADDALAFLDTNVLLYAYDASAGRRHERATELVGELASRRLAATSIQVLQEFYVNATRKIAKPLAHDVALQRVQAFARWPVHIPTAGDVVAAAELSHNAQVSLWDAMILRSASRLGCPVVWTEDLIPGQLIDGVTVRNPFALTG